MKSAWHGCQFLTSAVEPSGYPPPTLPEIALAGRSNVGKSSLLNALVGRRGLARVSGEPGRTQMINFFEVPGALRLVDLPGYGYAKVSKKQRAAWGPMIDAFLTERESLKGIILIVDVRHPPQPFDVQMAEWTKASGLAARFVATKADKLSRNQQAKQRRILEQGLGLPVLLFSARTGQGKEELQEACLQLSSSGAERERSDPGGVEDDTEGL